METVMARAKTEASLGKSTKSSGRAGLRADALRCKQGQSWIQSLRRTRRAIAGSVRLIDRPCRVLNACEKIAADHPIRATRQFQRICGWLGEATARLGRGAACLRATNNSVALAPAYAGDAPGLMIDAVARWIDAAEKLDAISNRWDDSFTALIGYIESGTAPLDLSELYRRIGPNPALIRLIIRRRPSLKFLSRESRRIFCIHVRRQRSARVTVTEAPKRIFRGRAPPFLSTCSL